MLENFRDKLHIFAGVVMEVCLLVMVISLTLLMMVGMTGLVIMLGTLL